MSAGDPAVGQEVTLGGFIGYLAEIAESDHPIPPIGGLLTASLRSGNLTAEGFFQHCILNVRGIPSEAENMFWAAP